MNFSDFYRPGELRFSFETFPPKDDKGVDSMLKALRELSPLNPAFISVTYGAMGTTHDLTRDLAIRIRQELGLVTAFHFTCVGSDRRSIQKYVLHLKEKGLNLIVGLRGDPPQGTGHFVKPENGFAYANELVAFLHSIGGFSIAVAAYPEGHIEAKDKETDLKNFVRKVRAGADIAITQLFFNNADYFDFVDRARSMGVTIPIIPGIMPILSVQQIEKISRLCGARIPDDLRLQLKGHESDPDQVREIGIQHAIRQCQELKKQGVPGIHFYTLNKSYSTKRVVEALRQSSP